MKVICYIYEKYKERGMLAFEKRIHTLLKNNGIELKDKEIICDNAYMIRGNGSSSYYMVAEIIINNESFEIKSHTNNSELWDDWFEPSAKDKRQLFESVLNNEIEQLKELLTEEETI